MNRYIFVLLIFCIFSCSKEDSEIEKILISLEGSIKNRNILAPIQSYPQDSLSLLLAVFNAEYKLFLEKNYPSKTNQEQLKILAALDIPTDSEIMLFAFQKYLNQQPINLNEIRKELKQIERNFSKQIAKENYLNEQKLKAIIKNNNLRWQVGDTVDIILQVNYENGYHSIFYKQYPASLDYSYADDTLKIKALITNKIYDSNYSSKENNHPFNLIFELEVLHINFNDSTTSLKIGEEFKLHLESYGRTIK